MTRLDRQQAFSGTKDIASGLGFDTERLGAYLALRLDGFGPPLTVRQFRGGQSNPTYLIETPTAKYVLRRKPPGKLLASAHAVDREYRVLSALFRQGFPVARPLHYCDDADVIGTAFYVMAHVAGTVYWEPELPGLTPAARAGLYDTMNATLARLHRFDPAEVGLADFGKPRGYVARQVRRWSENYRLSATQDIPEMDRLIALLPDRVPSDGRTAIVHGDYRLDNLIVDPASGQVRAVLDWELATLGDAYADFVYHAMTWVMPRTSSGAGTGSLVGFDLTSMGIPALQNYVEMYAKRLGLNEIPHLEFYFAYNFFRLAAILQGIVGRVRDGTATNADAAAMADAVRPLAGRGLDYAMKLR